ncbi:trypsin-2 [Penaeus vannamei]|uniref:Trypsin-2 n=1 Tax=Penaeus vannamei TaxID=6689 RepID=A0A3R7PQM7_PENVA|nr:trypsin-2 [Penaeus vannamei]
MLDSQLQVQGGDECLRILEETQRGRSSLHRGPKVLQETHSEDSNVTPVLSKYKTVLARRRSVHGQTWGGVTLRVRSPHPAISREGFALREEGVISARTASCQTWVVDLRVVHVASRIQVRWRLLVSSLSKCSCGATTSASSEGRRFLSPQVSLACRNLRDSVSRGALLRGSIISTRFVVTAAHCLFSRENEPKPLTNLRVRVAEHDVASEEDDLEGVTRMLALESYIFHEGFTEDYFNMDIALLRLEESLDLTSHPEVRPVCLPSDPTKVYQGQTGKVIGWGDTSNGNGQVPQHRSGSRLTHRRMWTQEDSRCFDHTFHAVRRLEEWRQGLLLWRLGRPLMVKETEIHLVGTVSFGEECANECSRRLHADH